MKYLNQCACGATAVLALGLLPSPPASAAGRIDHVTNLETARSVHSTSVLPSEQLLVAGGMGTGGASLRTAELVDLAAAKVRTVGSLVHSRASHTATTLSDGRVLLIGGYNGEYLESVETFDPATQRFTITGQLNEGRSGHTATQLADGRILIVGGVGRGWTFLASAEIYDPETGRSEMVGSLRVPRESHTATLLTDGRVLVVGGHQGRRQEMEVYASAEVYDPAARRFRPAGELTTPRHKHDAVRLADGRVLVIGGADRTDRLHYATTEVYDPSSAAFVPGPSMTNTRYKINGTSVRLANGDVLVPAGARTAELLDAGSFTFSAVSGEFPMAYYFATATPLSNGDVIIAGGYGRGIQNTAGVWRFRAR